jgi:hypothetical protein
MSFVRSDRTSKVESRPLISAPDGSDRQPLKVFSSIGALPFTVTVATMQLILMATTYVTSVFC